MLYILLGAYFAPQLNKPLTNEFLTSSVGLHLASRYRLGLQPPTVLIKRHVRSSKFNPLTDEVHLIEANPQYAHVQYPDEKEDTVALKHLAPKLTLIDKILETNRVVKVDSENPANDAAPANESFTTEDVDADPIQNERLINDPSCKTKLHRFQRVCNLLSATIRQIIDPLVNYFLRGGNCNDLLIC